MFITPNYKRNHVIYLVIMYLKKHHRESRETKFWKHVCPICNLHLSYNFVFMLQLCTCVTWECTCFQPIRNTYFFLYIIRSLSVKVVVVFAAMLESRFFLSTGTIKIPSDPNFVAWSCHQIKMICFATLVQAFTECTCCL